MTFDSIMTIISVVLATAGLVLSFVPDKAKKHVLITVIVSLLTLLGILRLYLEVQHKNNVDLAKAEVIETLKYEERTIEEIINLVDNHFKSHELLSKAIYSGLKNNEIEQRTIHINRTDGRAILVSVYYLDP